MAIPKLTPMPDPPLPTDPEAEFDARAGASMTAQVVFTGEMNASVIPGINAAVAQLDDDKDAAQEAASAAADSADSARMSQEASLGAQQQAQLYAAAAGSSAGLPALAGNARKALTVKTDESGVEFTHIGLAVGDALWTARYPGANFLRMDGGLYLQSAYPELFSMVGLLGGSSGTSWAVASSGITTEIEAIATNDADIWITGGLGSTGSSIRRSADAGATWLSITTPLGVGNVYGLATDALGIWVAVGNAGGQIPIIRSADDGLTWSSTGSLLAGAAVATDKRGVFIATVANNTGRRSADGGLTWSTVVSLTGAVDVATDETGTWITAGGALASVGAQRSVDNGITWLGTGTITTQSRCVATDKIGTWLIGGISGQIWRSVNNGMSWAVVASPFGGGTVNSICYDGIDTWLAGGDSGVLMRSLDGGASWSLVTSNRTTKINRLSVNTSQAWIAAGASGELTKSVPGYGYDPATMFCTPRVILKIQGITPYIKALEAA